MGSANLNSNICNGRSNTWVSHPRISLRNEKYMVLYNHFKARIFFECLESITFTTHGEYHYLDNLIPLLQKWRGPISVAVFAPGHGKSTKAVTDKCHSPSGEILNFQKSLGFSK